jgi:hypothetical protein
MSLWKALDDPRYAARFVEKPIRRGMETWPRTVSDPGDVPASFFHRTAELLRGQPEALPLMGRGSRRSDGNRLPAPVFLPIDQWGGTTVPQTLLYCDDRGLHIIREREAGREPLYHRLFPYSQLQRLEWGRVLLHSWLTMENPHASETIEFTTGAEFVLLPLIRCLRMATFGVEPADMCHHAAAELRRRDPRIDFKFANYAGQSLGRGEQLVTFGYLPESSSGVRTLILLTDREVIEIREETDSVHPRASYGGICSYMTL